MPKGNTMSDAKPQSKEVAIPEEYREIAAICTATEIEIGGKKVMGIADLRALHSGLKVNTAFDRWIKRRLVDNPEFVAGQDYEKVQEGFSPNLEKTKGGRPGHLYRGTLDTGKRLGLAEHNENGAMVRGYFIWAETQFLAGKGPTWQRLMDELDRRQEFQNQQIAELTTQLQKVNKFVAAFGNDPIATVGNCVKGVVNKRLTATEQEHGKRFSHLDEGVDELRDEAVFLTFTQVLKAFGVSGIGSNGSRGKSFHAHMDEHIKSYPDRATHRLGTGSNARYSKALVREFWGTFRGKELLMKILGPQQAGFDFGTGRPTSH
jgi:phage anti-repressor protein